ncbi:MAG: MFS transporter [Sedimentisphaerales bacterium]|nr:MFS transporter [Sedimentisphaerales bacterium]
MEENARFNLKYIWTICVVAALGGLLFGYDWVVIGGAKPFYEAFFGLTNPWLIGWAVSCAYVGCILGCVISGTLSDKFGRKRLLILAAFLFTLSAIGTGWSNVFVWFVLYRLLGGIGIGLASNLSPMYIAEVSPSKMRGRFVSVNQLTIVLGILAAMIVNYMIAEKIGKPVPTAEQIRIASDEAGAMQAIAADEYDQKRQEALAVMDADILVEVQERFATVGYAPDMSEEAKSAEDTAIVHEYYRRTWNGQRGWRWMFWAETIPATLFFLFMFPVPESPRWLVKNGKPDKAGSVLARIGGAAYSRDALIHIQNSLRNEIKKVNFRELLEPGMMKILALGIFLAAFQQWCGINVIFNYAHEIFTRAGYSISGMLVSILLTGVTNTVFTFVAMATVDRWGRRRLMLFGAISLALVYTCVGAAYFFGYIGAPIVVLTVVAVGCYAMSLAPITWVVLSEIYPNRIRGAAMSVSVTSLWIACFMLIGLFPFMVEFLRMAGTFWTFAGICVVGSIVIFRRLPETKGKSLEELEVELVGTTHVRDEVQ